MFYERFEKAKITIELLYLLQKNGAQQLSAEPIVVSIVSIPIWL